MPPDDAATELALPIAAPTPAEGIDALVAVLGAYNPRSDAARIRAAHAYAADAHAGQRRRSGEPYITHPLAVAGILAGQRMDDATVITALLHDTVEDTGSTSEEIARLFGADIAGLVDGVTKLTNFELTSHQTKQAENFRKLFMAMAQDMRVIVVKLADRLHNMRTLGAMPDSKREQKARETMEIFAPLAGRMGMQSVRDELEDLAFHVLDPVARTSVMRRFASLRSSQGNVVEEITADLEALLARSGVPAQVMGRAKRPYSIWRKMEAKNLTFQRLSDIWGFRVVTETEDDCYVALGAIHRRWAAVPGRFKDYISQPKQNGYRSIHATVSGRDAKRVEVQIRSREMHDVAESGIAAHWSYRDGAPGQNRFAVDPSRWVAAMAERFGVEGSGTTENDEEFLEAVKLEMYADQVFCFTPKGDVVKLPKGADADRLRLRHPHPHRRRLRRRARRQPAPAALAPPAQRPVGRDHHRRGLAPAGRLARGGRHGPRQVRHPPLAARRGARALHPAGPRARARRLRRRRQRGQPAAPLDRRRAHGRLQRRGAARAHRLDRDQRPRGRRPDAAGRRGAGRGRRAAARTPTRSSASAPTSARCAAPAASRVPGERIIGITYRGRGRRAARRRLRRADRRRGRARALDRHPLDRRPPPADPRRHPAPDHRQHRRRARPGAAPPSAGRAPTSPTSPSPTPSPTSTASASTWRSPTPRTCTASPPP